MAPNPSMLRTPSGRQTCSRPRRLPRSDSVDISPAADLAGRLSDIPDIRQDRVSAIKLAIANGTYETADKLSGAVSRLLDEIG